MEPRSARFGRSCRAAAGVLVWVLLAALPAAAEPLVRVKLGSGRVLRVPLERYVAAAVNGEMPTAWPAASLRAQAIVSRTYALHEMRVHATDAYDVSADTRGQVYAPERVADSVRSAVADTRGGILTFAGAPILAAFHSASGGRTASAAEVWGESRSYLVSHAVDGEDDSPSTYWRVPVSHPTLGRALGRLGLRVGTPVGISVSERSASGRVQTLEVRGSRGVASLSGRELRGALGETLVKSTLFEIVEASAGDSSVPAPGIVLVGTGYGHGVGMSQWGARAMARRGASHEAILERFYPGTRLRQLDESGLARLMRDEDPR